MVFSLPLTLVTYIFVVVTGGCMFQFIDQFFFKLLFENFLNFQFRG